MSTLVIVIIAIIAALVGAAIMFFVRKPTAKTDKDSEKVITQLKEDLKAQANSFKEKYDKLLMDSESQISNLNQQLSSALDGKLDEATKDSLAQVDYLKKKLKEFETEIEDYEDDLEDAKKKLRKKEEESASLHDSLASFEREVKHLKDDINSLNNALGKTQNELSLKGESLSFVQEILSAKEAKDDKTNELYKRIAEVVDFVEGDLRDNVKEIYEISPELDKVAFGEGLYNWAARAKKSWVAENKVSVALVGEFSAGKTSIVNRILSQDKTDVPLLPVSTKATTAIPTYITGYPGASFQFVSPDNNLKTISEGTFKRVNKEVLDQIHGVSSLIKYFVMGYKNPNLDSLSILDTPGFNSNDPEDANRTIEVINECDALFWVFDVNTGTVNRSSLQLIKDHLTKPLYIVINKVDTKPQSEIDKVEKLIRKTLSDAEIAVQGFIRFSSKAPLSAIMTPIMSIQRNDSDTHYLDDLKETIGSWVNELQQTVLDQKKESDDLSKKIDSICNKYNKATGQLGDDCETAAKIPQYRDGFLGIGRGYKMDDNQYNTLISTLQRICSTRVDKLVDLFNEMMGVAMDYSTSLDNHERARRNWQSLNESNERLNKLTKGLR